MSSFYDEFNHRTLLNYKKDQLNKIETMVILTYFSSLCFSKT